MVVLFVGTESTFAYFEATHKYLERNGKPLAFYSDKASLFRVNKRPGIQVSPKRTLALTWLS